MIFLWKILGTIGQDIRWLWEDTERNHPSPLSKLAQHPSSQRPNLFLALTLKRPCSPKGTISATVLEFISDRGFTLIFRCATTGTFKLFDGTGKGILGG